MKNFFLFIGTILFFFHSQLFSQETRECLTSDYRYLLQRAWDEGNNKNLIEKANEYLGKLKEIYPECSSQIVREIEQNNQRISAVRYINTNSYPFTYAFSNSMKNQKEFTDGIQVAIEDGVSELKTIMEKLVIREGQIPILIIFDFEDTSLTEKQILDRREEYFSYIFKNLEGIYFYAAYNRIEHNELLGEIPLSNKVLEKENLSEIYSRVMKLDKWNKLFIIRLSEKNILKNQYIFKYSQNSDDFKNHSFITLDLFRVSESSDVSKKLDIQLYASADVTGIRIETYFIKSAYILIFGVIIFCIFFFYFLYIKDLIRLDDYFQKDSKIIWRNYFIVILLNTFLLFIITSLLFPHNKFFENILGEWLEVSSKSSLYFIFVSLIGLILFYLLFTYILTSKFIDSYFLFKENIGLPLLFGMSGYGIILSIVYKISIYIKLYNFFYDQKNYYIYSNVALYALFFIISFISIGVLVQDYIKLDSINIKLYFLKEKFSTNFENNKKENINKEIRNIYIQKYLALFILLGFILYVDFFFIQIMKADLKKLAKLYTSLHLNITFIISIFFLILLKFKKNDFTHYDEKVSSEKDLENISNKEDFINFFTTECDEYRFNLEEVKKEELHNFIFVNGLEHSGKKEIVRKIINQMKKVNELKIININFSDKLSWDNELSKFIEIGKYIIPEISVVHKSREFSKNIHETSKSPILNFIENIPFIGRLLNLIISSDRIYDEKKVEEDLIKDVSKIYIEYIKFIIRKKDSNIKFLLVLENIHCCNSFSFEVLLNILNEFYPEQDIKDKNTNVYFFLTGKFNINFKKNDRVKIDFIEQSKNFRNNIKINKTYRSVFEFQIFNTKGFDLEEFKMIMRNQYSFARTSFNDHFIYKIYYTLKINKFSGKIFLHDVNLALRYTYKMKQDLFKFNKSINKIVVSDIIDDVNLHPDLVINIKDTLKLLTKEEEHIVLATTILHDWFTIEQISYTIGINVDKLQYLIFNLIEKLPEIYMFKDNRYFRINKKIREYFKTEVLNNNTDESIKNLKLNLFAKNFINFYTPKKNDTINDFKKLSYFSLFLDDPDESLKLNSFYIRESYYNFSDRIKVLSVLENLAENVVINCSMEMQIEYLYLVSIHDSYKKSLGKQVYFKKTNKLIKKILQIKTNINTKKRLAMVLMEYNFKKDLKIKKKVLDSNKLLDIFKNKLIKNFTQLIDESLDEKGIIEAWVIYFISYFVKEFLFSKEDIYKNIYKELLMNVNEKLLDKKILEELLFGESSQNNFNKYQPIHEILYKKLEFIIKFNNEIKLNQSSKYIELDMEIKLKDLRHIKTRLDNTLFELYVRDLPNDKNILSNSSLKSDMESEFKECINLSKNLNNLTGLAITEYLFSYHYFYHKQLEKAHEHVKNSFNRNQDIMDYNGMILTHKLKVNILNELLLKENNDKWKQELNETLEEIKIFESHNPDSN